MLLTVQQSYGLLARHGCFAREICDECGLVLGAIRFTRKDVSGEWCSRKCRGDDERKAIRKGGRPRKYKTPKERRRAKTRQQRDYRAVSMWKKHPHKTKETKNLRARKLPLSYFGAPQYGESLISSQRT